MTEREQLHCQNKASMYKEVVSLNTVDTVDQETFLLIITKNLNYYSAQETLKLDTIH